MQSLAAELAEAAKSEEGIAARLDKIHKEAAVGGDRRSAWRHHYAGLLKSSPKPEGTLKQLNAQEPLPEFHHINEETGD